MNENNLHHQNKISPRITMLGLAWDIRWVFRLICMLIFLDIAMLFYFQEGVLQANKDILNNPGWAVISFIIFGILATIIVPGALGLGHFLILFTITFINEKWKLWGILIAIFAIIAYLITGDKYRLFALLFYDICIFIIKWNEGKDENPSEGHIYLHALKRIAMEKKDEFLAQRYKDEKEESMKKRSLKYETLSISTLLLLMAFTDFWMTGKFPDNGSLTDSVIRFLPVSLTIPNLGYADIIFLNMGLSFLLTCVTWRFFDMRKPDLIYYPCLQKDRKMAKTENFI